MQADKSISHYHTDPKLIEQTNIGLFDIGTPLYLDSDGLYKIAKADQFYTSNVVGMVWQKIGNDKILLRSEPCHFQYNNPLGPNWFTLNDDGVVNPFLPNEEKIPGEVGNRLYLSDISAGLFLSVPTSAWPVIIGYKTQYGFIFRPERVTCCPPAEPPEPSSSSSSVYKVCCDIYNVNCISGSWGTPKYVTSFCTDSPSKLYSWIPNFNQWYVNPSNNCNAKMIKNSSNSCLSHLGCVSQSTITPSAPAFPITGCCALPIIGDCWYTYEAVYSCATSSWNQLIPSGTCIPTSNDSFVEFDWTLYSTDPLLAIKLVKGTDCNIVSLCVPPATYNPSAVDGFDLSLCIQQSSSSSSSSSSSPSASGCADGCNCCLTTCFGPGTTMTVDGIGGGGEILNGAWSFVTTYNYDANVVLWMFSNMGAYMSLVYIIDAQQFYILDTDPPQPAGSGPVGVSYTVPNGVITCNSSTGVMEGTVINVPYFSGFFGSGLMTVGFV